MVADFYAARLHDHFAAPARFLEQIRGSTARLEALRGDVATLRGCVGASEQTLLDDLESMVIAKDGLDFHESHQSLLKGWLFAHIPLTYLLLLCALLHVLLVHAFGAGR